MDLLPSPHSHQNILHLGSAPFIGLNLLNLRNRRSLMSDLDGASSAAENILDDETDDGGARRLLLSDSQVEQESETSGPTSENDDEDEAATNCETAKSNKR